MFGCPHATALVEVSAEAWAEIAQRLRDAGHPEAFAGSLLDLHGIALAPESADQRRERIRHEQRELVRQALTPRKDFLARAAHS